VSAHRYDAEGNRVRQAWTADGETIAADTELFYDDDDGTPVVKSSDIVVPDFDKGITLEAFVSEGTIDPLFYDDAYCLFPAKGGEDGLGLVADILRRDSLMTFAGTAVFTDRPRSVVIRWSDAAGCLVLHTLTFVSRVRFYDIAKTAEGLREPSAELRTQAGLLTDALPDTFLPLDADAREVAIADALAKSAPPAAKGKTPVPAVTASDILDTLRADVQDRADRTKGKRTKGTTKGRTTTPTK
jgi:non-homologous end joining protein Ku